MPIIDFLAWGSLVLWSIVFLLPWLPWRNREVLDASAAAPVDFDEITVVIPARNESDVILRTLQGLARQSEHLKVVLVDDRSEDGTAICAAQSSLINLRIVEGKPLAEGWSGKLWAQNQGVRLVETPLALFLDADVYLDDGILAALVEKKRKHHLNFVSLMAKPSLCRFWETALMPAFVYFFKLLYPFALSNSADPRFASAAGGCILLDTEILPAIGGLQSIKSAIIDDCTLAKRVKAKGYRTWTGLTQNLYSQRSYETLSDLWDMVARTAFTQLRYSTLLLGLCTVVMVIMFIVPAITFFSGDVKLITIGSSAFALMAATYLPILHFYQCTPTWVLGLPAVALAYLAMTWTSALRYWNGEKSRWKNRVYVRQTQSETAQHRIGDKAGDADS
jgi:hopene-associated glycosyltransferase HpnB